MAVAGVIQNVDIIDLFLLTNTRIMRWAGHAARKGVERRMQYFGWKY